MRIGEYNVGFKGISKVENSEPETNKNETLITKIVERQLYRINASVGDWRKALNVAESVHNPATNELIRVYNEVVLDSHLQSVIQQRISKVLAKNYMIVDSSGEIDETTTELFKKTWFNKTIKYIMEANFWGFSLIQFGDLVNNNFEYIELFKRENVEPNSKEVKTEPYLNEGISFESEPYSDWVFFVESELKHGLLNQASPLALWKRGSLNSWSDFAEIFGIPPRIGRTDVRDKDLRNAMTQALKNMGRLSYAVLDHDDTMDIVESSKTDSFNVFLKMAEYMDSQMSKLILGQTGTTDEKAFSGSASVHERVGNEITQADCIWVETIINDKFFPFLTNLGFKLEGKRFKFDTKEQFSKDKQFEITKELLGFYDIPEQWINDTFNVPVEAKKVPAVAKTIKSNIDRYKKIVNSLDGFYLGFPYNEEESNLFTEEEQSTIIAGIYAGSITPEDLSPEMYKKTSELLIKNVNKGFGNVDKVKSDELLDMVKAFQSNTYVFSGAKTHEQTKIMSDFVFDSKGQKVSFKLFKEKASEVLDTFNKNYLQAEQRTAIAQANAGRDWERIQSQKDTLKMLEYTTAGDNRVRAEHQDLAGIIRPVDDSFWGENYPPNGWRCRCDVNQLESGKVTPLNELIKFKKVEPVSELFRMNAGIDKVIFPEEHPYFKSATKEQLETNFGFGIPEEITK